MVKKISVSVSDLTFATLEAKRNERKIGRSEIVEECLIKTFFKANSGSFLSMVRDIKLVPNLSSIAFNSYLLLNFHALGVEA